MAVDARTFSIPGGAFVSEASQLVSLATSGTPPSTLQHGSQRYKSVNTICGKLVTAGSTQRIDRCIFDRYHHISIRKMKPGRLIPMLFGVLAVGCLEGSSRPTTTSPLTSTERAARRIIQERQYNPRTALKKRQDAAGESCPA